MNSDNLKIRRGVGIIIDLGDKWLLQKRDNKDGILWPGKISMWGGTMEPEDEGNYDRTAARELLEETGLTPGNAELTCYGSLEFEHFTVSGEPVWQASKIYVVKPKPDIGIHINEGVGSAEIPANPDLSVLNTEDYATGVVEAIAKLKEYYSYESKA